MIIKNKFIIIDGNALLHRAWHALPALTTKKGELVNAVYGFALVFLKVLKDLKPTYITVTFDKKAPCFRHQEFKEYKATRKKQPDELYQQIPRIKKILGAFNVPIFEKQGFEADDLIGTLAQKTKDAENIIVTGDLDTLQLINENTKVYTLKRGVTESVLYDQEKVKERYGLKPEQLIDFKALRGDPSDNIPGVKGIGEKTAVNLLKEFNTLENVYQNLDKTKERIKKLLEKYKKDAFLSKKLVTIIKNVPMKFNLADCKTREFDRDKVVSLFRELEFKTLLNRIPQLILTPSNSMHEVKMSKTENYQLIDNQEKFEKFLENLKKQDAFAVDTETTGTDPFQAKLLGISFCWGNEEAYYVRCQMSDARCQMLKPILENPQIKKYGHNIKFDMEVLAEAGIELKGIEFDTMIASYLLNPGSRAHKLDNLVFTELGHQMVSLKELIEEKTPQPTIPGALFPGLPMEQIPLEKLAHYSCEDADYTFRLVSKLKSELKEKNLLNLFQKIEIPLVPILALIERNGVKIDVKFLKILSKNLKSKILNLKSAIYKLAGSEFNIASPVQLKKILFEKLKISIQDIKKIKTGLSTAASELEKLRGQHPIIDLILEYRELTKLKSTYLDALPALVNPKTGRIHTSFNQTITATGRLSSSKPNLQNIPIRTELGREIRKAFVVNSPGTHCPLTKESGRMFIPKYKLLSADYSQIELRIIASLANDQKMIAAFQTGEDIHKRTASEIFSCSLDEVTPQIRRQTKTINFGIIYGMGNYGLAQVAGISREEAKDFMDKYFKVYTGIKEYMEQTKALARSLGYAETLFGRCRWLPDIVSGVAQIRNAAERMAINFPVQGTAADIMKLAMIQMNHELGIMNHESIRMILQVHDELVFEVREDLVEQAAQIIKKIMETVAKLKVPIIVDISIGNNWGEMERCN